MNAYSYNPEGSELAKKVVNESKLMAKCSRNKGPRDTSNFLQVVVIVPSLPLALQANSSKLHQ